MVLHSDVPCPKRPSSTFTSKRPVVIIEAVYIDRDFYVHVGADTDETVHTYSVTTRSKRFRPSFRPSGGFAVERHWPLKKWDRFRYRFVPNPAVKLGTTRSQTSDAPIEPPAGSVLTAGTTSRRTTSATLGIIRRSCTASTTLASGPARRSN